MPLLRLDGYYIISDLTGVPDILNRLRPILTSIIPGRKPDAKVSELKPWVRVAVTIYIVTLIPAMLFALVMLRAERAARRRHGVRLARRPRRQVLVGAGRRQGRQRRRQRAADGRAVPADRGHDRDGRAPRPPRRRGRVALVGGRCGAPRRARRAARRRPGPRRLHVVAQRRVPADPARREGHRRQRRAGAQRDSRPAARRSRPSAQASSTARRPYATTAATSATSRSTSAAKIREEPRGGADAGDLDDPGGHHDDTASSPPNRRPPPPVDPAPPAPTPRPRPRPCPSTRHGAHAMTPTARIRTPSPPRAARRPDALRAAGRSPPRQVLSGAKDNEAVAEPSAAGDSVIDLAFSVRETASDVIDETNTAVAYANCEACRAVAIAFQIVIVQGSTRAPSRRRTSRSPSTTDARTARRWPSPTSSSSAAASRSSSPRRGLKSPREGPQGARQARAAVTAS